jgi:ankyrin repeat protein
VECMRLLLEKNADVTIANQNGDTGFTMAAWYGHPKCLKLLIEANADVNHQNNNGLTGLHSACQ